MRGVCISASGSRGVGGEDVERTSLLEQHLSVLMLVGEEIPTYGWPETKYRLQCVDSCEHGPIVSAMRCLERYPRHMNSLATAMVELLVQGCLSFEIDWFEGV